jgi:hypothetical protein
VLVIMLTRCCGRRGGGSFLVLKSLGRHGPGIQMLLGISVDA